MTFSELDPILQLKLRKVVRTNKETMNIDIEDSDVVLMINGKVDSIFTNKTEILFENYKIVKITKF